MYKYFTWTDDEGYFRGQQLLCNEQISTLLSHLPSKSEAFATIQDYDAEGNCIGCPLYFDIDSPSLWDAYHEMQELVEDLRAALDIEPLVWFSGSKEEGEGEIPEHKYLGPLTEFRRIVEEQQPDRIVVAISEHGKVLPHPDLLELGFSGIPIQDASAA